MGKSQKRHWVGFDLGGTKMLAVVYDEAVSYTHLTLPTKA